MSGIFLPISIGVTDEYEIIEMNLHNPSSQIHCEGLENDVGDDINKMMSKFSIPIVTYVTYVGLHKVIMDFLLSKTMVAVWFNENILPNKALPRLYKQIADVDIDVENYRTEFYKNGNKILNVDKDCVISIANGDIMLTPDKLLYKKQSTSIMGKLLKYIEVMRYTEIYMYKSRHGEFTTRNIKNEIDRIIDETLPRPVEEVTIRPTEVYTTALNSSDNSICEVVPRNSGDNK